MPENAFGTFLFLFLALEVSSPIHLFLGRMFRIQNLIDV